LLKVVEFFEDVLHAPIEHVGILHGVTGQQPHGVIQFRPVVDLAILPIRLGVSDLKRLGDAVNQIE